MDSSLIQPAGSTPLTGHRRERFCLEVLKDDNQTQAAIRAGYSLTSARRQASRLSTNVHVSARVAFLRGQRSAKISLQVERIDQELERLVLFDIRKAATWGDGNLELKASDELDGDTAAGIVEVIEETTENISVEGVTRRVRRRRIKGPNKIAAIELLLKRKGALNLHDGPRHPCGPGIVVQVLTGPHIRNPQAAPRQLINGVLVLSKPAEPS